VSVRDHDRAAARLAATEAGAVRMLLHTCSAARRSRADLASTAQTPGFSCAFAFASDRAEIEGKRRRSFAFSSE